MNATVIYPKDKTFIVNVPEEACKSVRDTLAWLWEALQNGIEEITKRTSETELLNKNCDARARSSMVGDLYVFDGQHFMVDGHGFRVINPIQFFELQRAEDRDRLMGWDWMKEHNIVTGEAEKVE
jgi:hypothetical protein